jgi:hypothetical protein
MPEPRRGGFFFGVLDCLPGGGVFGIAQGFGMASNREVRPQDDATETAAACRD